VGFDSTGRALVGYGQVLSYHPVSTRVALAERRNGAWVDVWEKCSQGDVIPIAITLGVGADGKRAVFADTHARVGILPGGGMTARLPLRVGAAMARRLSMTGEVVDAAWAERIGLVTEVVVHDELLSRAIQLAEQIAEVPDPPWLGSSRCTSAAPPASPIPRWPSSSRSPARTGRTPTRWPPVRPR